MLTYLKGLQAKKPVLWTGDLNVALLDIDIHDPKRNKKTAGFTDQERAEFRKYFDNENFVDTLRMFNKDVKDLVRCQFSHFCSTRIGAIVLV